MKTSNDAEEQGGSFASREPAYLNLDAQLGYWLYRGDSPEGLTGLQGKLELHYTGTNSPYEPAGGVAAAPGSLFSSGLGEVDYWNATVGLTALFNDRATLTTALVVPIRSGSNNFVDALGLAAFNGPGAPFPSDRLFDWEMVMQFNYYFGN